ncbi:hypothetical protein [Amycolatopsis jejuensis]|uniref:hypothetical protein n=1 Tax=Amycolatopsis jejuensis TaxID=330084 RepID=UPI000526F4A7|nr:hypothetical protein [Amycolatopsis jejuensis]
MRSEDIAQDILVPKPSGERDIGLRVGVVLSWDTLTGENVVEIEGEAFPNLRAVQGGIGIRYTQGDVVVVMKKQTTFFILGRVAAPGGAAGSAVQYDRLGAGGAGLPSTGGAWQYFSDNRASVTTYIGSSCAALVLWSVDVAVNQSQGEIGWEITGASSVLPGAFTGMSIQLKESGALTPSPTVSATVSGHYVMSFGAGLRQGLNTFTMMYRVAVTGAGTGADFGNRTLTVIPL